MIDETGPVELIYHHGTEPLVFVALILALLVTLVALALSVGKK